MKSISTAMCLKSKFGKMATIRLYGRKGLAAGAPDNSKSGAEYAFNFATVPFLAEILKLLISCWLLRQQKLNDPEVLI